MNRMTGLVAGIERFGSIALVDVDTDQTNLRLTATVIGMMNPADDRLIQGTKVNLLFAETDVALAKNLSGMISMRNRISCNVIGIDRGRLLTHVSLVLWGASDLAALAHPLTALITTRSSYSLDLAIGDHVEALVKANDMRLEISEQ